jgi:uncharacterized membrane protein
VKVAREPDAPTAPVDRPGPAARRVIAAAVSGLVSAVVALAVGASWSVAALCASDVAALVFVVWVWINVRGADPAATAQIARTEDASPVAAESVLIGAGAASLLAVGFTLAQAGKATAPARGLLTALAVASVALAWTSVHTVHVLRYARLYYSPPEGGIDFGEERRLRLSGGDDRDVLPGLRHGPHGQARAARGSAPCPAVLPVRHRDRGDHRQCGRRPSG